MAELLHLDRTPHDTRSARLEHCGWPHTGPKQFLPFLRNRILSWVYLDSPSTARPCPRTRTAVTSWSLLVTPMAKSTSIIPVSCMPSHHDHELTMSDGMHPSHDSCARGLAVALNLHAPEPHGDEGTMGCARSIDTTTFERARLADGTDEVRTHPFPLFSAHKLRERASWSSAGPRTSFLCRRSLRRAQCRYHVQSFNPRPEGLSTFCLQHNSEKHFLSAA